MANVPNKTGLGGKLLEGLGQASSVLTGGVDLLGPIGQLASIFTKSPLDKDKQVAAGSQQNIEKVALDIEKRVASGQLRPEAALVALNSLEKQAAAMGGMKGESGTGSPFGAGSQTASLIINQVKSNIQSRLMNDYDAFVNAPFKGTEGPGAGEMNTLQDAGANEGLQKTRLRTGLRNYFLGANKDLEGTPITAGFQKPDPYANLPKAQEQVDKYFKPMALPGSVVKKGAR